MRTQSAAQENLAAAVTPPIRPRSPWRVSKVEALPDYKLRVEFNDGLKGVVDMAILVVSKGAGVFAALADPQVFNQAHVESGAVTWPGEVDLAPDAMHSAIAATGQWIL